ncbi:MAG: hypothetical protein WCT04_15935 [Planctomycetota bacterium]
MARAPQHTLFLFDSGRTLRGDFAATGECTVTTSRAGGDRPLLNAVETALTLAPKLGRNVWVASANLWVQSVTLPSAVANRLSGSELSAALAFEAEPLSGIASTDAEIGCVPGATLPDGSREFQLVALDRSVRDTVQNALSSQGGMLRGICAMRDLSTRESAASDTEWLTVTLAQITAQPTIVPLITAAPRAVSMSRVWVIAAVVEVAALALCFAHWRLCESETVRLAAEATALRVPQKQIEDMRKSLVLARAEYQEADRRNQAATALRETFTTAVQRQRERVTDVLRRVADERPGNVIVQSIHADNADTVRVDGLCMKPELADEFAARLKRSLEAHSISVVPIAKTAQGVMSNGGPWRFTLEISTTPPPPVTKPSSTPLAASKKGEGR